MVVTLKRINEKEVNVIFLPQSMVSNFHGLPKRLTLRLGGWKREVKVELNSELPDKTVGLPHALQFPFELPLHFPYEANIKSREFHLGPILAFLAFKKKSEITEQILNNYKAYFTLSPLLAGLLTICAADGINVDEKTMEGYYLDYSTNGNKPIWKAGTFPLPDAFYNTTDLEMSIYNKLLAVYDETFFNTHPFNREEWCSWLNSHSSLQHYIPPAEQFSTIKHNDMLHLKVIMQKDHSKYWNLSGSIACFTEKREGSHIDQLEKALSGYDGLKEVFKMNECEIFVKERELFDLCTLACKTLEQYGGHYADLLFEISLDKERKPWITEIFPLYDHTLPLSLLNNKEMYLKVVTTPFQYAKSLVGFK
ncbi:YheC/YheD family protein [Bacillus taeanensis]|uniref:Uncharacterized protein n=1 Tax=Bacillus taeanensis TaxID=273032 RepID=A0A366XZV9_9BACI|nr:YheC/YheD family protein [Bacillus taeanensis]RBW69451.1 hypothetical protein DS031_11035 [Bacillus taeanensis]